MSDAPHDAPHEHDEQHEAREEQDGGVLDREALAMLRAFRAEERIPSAVHERVWSRVEANVTAKATIVEPRWFRRGAGLGVLVAAAVAVLWIGRQALDASQVRESPNQAGYDERSDEERGGVAHPRAPQRVKSPEPVPHESAGAPADAPPDAPPVAPVLEHSRLEPAARPELDRRSSASERRRAEPEPEPTPTPGSTLAAENRLLAQARAALIDERPELALRRLAEHAQSFPQGVLAEERLALRAVALCEAGRDAEGEAAAQAFLREHPQAALTQRVRGACLDQ